MQTKNRLYLLPSLLTVIIPALLCMSACDKLNTLVKKDSPAEEPPAKIKKDSASPSKQTAPIPEKITKNTSAPPKTTPTPRRKPSLTEIPVEAPVSLPLDREITDIAGRKINVTITARYENEIALVRKGESKTFNLPLQKLSKEDRAIILTLPISEKPPEIDPYIAREMVRNERRHEEIAKNRKDIASASLNTSQKRGLMTREKKLLKEIEASEKEIKKHQQK